TQMYRVVLLCLGLSIASSAASADPAGDCNQSNDLNRRIRGCTEFIRQNPKNLAGLAIAYRLRASAYDQKGRRDLAIEDYGKAIKPEPRNVLAYYNRGLLFLDEHEYDSARAEFDKLAEIDAKSVLPQLGRGLAFLYEEAHESALAEFANAERAGHKD